MAGVIGHVVNPTPEEAADVAVVAEQAGAEWIGLADAFWWRDVWMLLVEVARRTTSIRIGPAMTNPYLRHPFHTVSALATLGELAGDRLLLGVAAGGSEVTHAAGIDRRDAADRARALVELVGDVSEGRPLDPASGRGLDLTLPRPRVLMAARGDAMLRVAGRVADDVLLWAIPDGDLERSIAVVRDGAAGRDRAPRLVWAPLVRHHEDHEPSLLHVAVYASLNTRPALRSRWGLDEAGVARIRAALLRGGTAEAASLVPEAALAELISEPDVERIAARGRAVGVGAVATPGFDAAHLADQLAWAAGVEADLDPDDDLM